MKKIYGFAFAAAIMSLASCSNDSEPVVNPTPEEAEAGYLAINISAPATTRADEGNLEAATDPKENYAEKGTFLFFNGQYQTQVPQSVMIDWKANLPANAPAGVEKVSEAIVTVAGNGSANKPQSVLVILNDPFGPAHYTNMTLMEVLDETAKEANSVSSNNGFIMTNSTYFVNGETQVATPIGDNVKTTRQEAKEAAEAGNGVDIYVERLTAKVTPVKHNSFEIKSTGDFQVNGMDEKINLTPVITGLSVANVAKDEYLFKHVDESWIAKWEGVDDNKNFRSNWAVTPETTYTNMSYVGYDATLGDQGIDSELLPIYIKENTSATKSALLVTAKLTLDGETAIEALVRWAGLYFTPESFKTQALNFTQGYYKPGKDAEGKDAFVSLEASDLAYLAKDVHAAMVGTKVGSENKEEFHAYEQALQLTDSEMELYDSEGKVIANAAETLNAILLDKANRCWYWNEGKAYYFVNIEHYGPLANVKPDDADEDWAAEDFREGVVRNHIYQVTLKSLSGIGVPVFNPDLVIIPEKVKDELWYLGADINILKWKIVKQDANFNDVPL
ncbi:MAG: Mfa1 family fimbria major subunit [Muribaculaceae bacterium]|nr:Mfa1 family fimbria major subunit [Muribaculaceae bacterium]